LIDIAADFRLKNNKIYKKYYGINSGNTKKNFKSIYGLPEIKKKQINKFKIIACPGCYPTSILIPLYPLLNKKLIDPNNIIIDSKSGYSGAGRGVHKKYKGKNLYASTSVYGIPNHRHNAEIQQELELINKKVRFTFTPHILPMFRGIISSIYVNLKKNVSANKVLTTLRNFYKNEDFINVQNLNRMLSTNDVINTNKINISVCKSKEKNKIIILSALDNLIKGGAGQAIQNLNIIFGYKNDEGLK